MRESLESQDGLVLHDLRGDVDANRTWVSFSGVEGVVEMMGLCSLAFERIHLQHHVGEHPRLGALDLCTFTGGAGAASTAETFARSMAELHAVPTYLAHVSDAWFALREQGFGSLFERTLRPDFGPPQVHEGLGVAGVWARPFYLTVACDVDEERADFLKMRLRDIQQRREDGDPMFAGVDAVAYAAPSDACSRIVIEFADPDLAPPDPVVSWLDRRARVAGLRLRSVEAIGAVRRTDLLETRTMPIREAQLIDLP